MKMYDAIIIGSGQAGTPLAVKLAEAGYKTAIIEERFVGGTCINYGCTPSKTLISSAKVAWQVKNSSDWGIKTDSVEVDFKKVQSRKDEILKGYRQGIEKNLKHIPGLDLIYGKAEFTGVKTIRVTSGSKKASLLKANLVFINAGCKPAIPPIPGLEDVSFLDSTALLNLKEIPQQLIIIGAGYISLELGQMYSRFGSKVTILEKSHHFLEHEDEDIASELRNILEAEGLTILTGCDIKSVQNTSGDKILVNLSLDDKRKRLTCSHLLLATGRIPQTGDLHLEACGINTDEKGFIPVSNKLQTNVKGVFALGDIKGGPAFTHISYNDHLVIAKNLIGNKSETIKNRLVPYCVFTDPQLGRIGITEKEALQKGLKFKVAKLPLSKVARAVETGESHGLMKAIVDKKSGLILGAAILAGEGGEVMAVLEMAMMGKVKATEIRDAIFAHPTWAESLNNLFMTLE